MVERFDYAGAALDADELLAEFGMEITLTRPNAGNAATFDAAQPAASAYVMLGASLPASKGTIQAFDNRVELGSLTDARLRYIILSARMKKVSGSGPASVEPQSGDVLTFAGQTWYALGCTPLSPAGVPVYFGVGCKRE